MSHSSSWPRTLDFHSKQHQFESDMRRQFNAPTSGSSPVATNDGVDCSIQSGGANLSTQRRGKHHEKEKTK